MRTGFAAIAGMWAGLAFLASIADRRRLRRADPDRIGWIPWPLVLILSLLAAAIFAGLAMVG